MCQQFRFNNKSQFRVFLAKPQKAADLKLAQRVKDRISVKDFRAYDESGVSMEMIYQDAYNSWYLDYESRLLARRLEEDEEEKATKLRELHEWEEETRAAEESNRKEKEAQEAQQRQLEADRAEHVRVQDLRAKMAAKSRQLAVSSTHSGTRAAPNKEALPPLTPRTTSLADYRSAQPTATATRPPVPVRGADIMTKRMAERAEFFERQDEADEMEAASMRHNQRLISRDDRAAAKAPVSTSFTSQDARGKRGTMQEKGTLDRHLSPTRTPLTFPITSFKAQHKAAPVGQPSTLKAVQESNLIVLDDDIEDEDGEDTMNDPPFEEWREISSAPGMRTADNALYPVSFESIPAAKDRLEIRERLYRKNPEFQKEVTAIMTPIVGAFATKPVLTIRDSYNEVLECFLLAAHYRPGVAPDLNQLFAQGISHTMLLDAATDQACALIHRLGDAHELLKQKIASRADTRAEIEALANGLEDYVSGAVDIETLSAPARQEVVTQIDRLAELKVLEKAQDKDLSELEADLKDPAVVAYAADGKTRHSKWMIYLMKEALKADTRAYNSERARQARELKQKKEATSGSEYAFLRKRMAGEEEPTTNKLTKRDDDDQDDDLGDYANMFGPPARYYGSANPTNNPASNRSTASTYHANRDKNNAGGSTRGRAEEQPASGGEQRAAEEPGERGDDGYHYGSPVPIKREPRQSGWHRDDNSHQSPWADRGAPASPAVPAPDTQVYVQYPNGTAIVAKRNDTGLEQIPGTVHRQHPATIHLDPTRNKGIIAAGVPQNMAKIVDDASMVKQLSDNLGNKRTRDLKWTRVHSAASGEGIVPFVQEFTTAYIETGNDTTKLIPTLLKFTSAGIKDTFNTDIAAMEFQHTNSIDFDRDGRFITIGKILRQLQIITYHGYEETVMMSEGQVTKLIQDAKTKNYLIHSTWMEVKAKNNCYRVLKGNLIAKQQKDYEVMLNLIKGSSNAELCGEFDKHINKARADAGKERGCDYSSVPHWEVVNEAIKSFTYTASPPTPPPGGHATGTRQFSQYNNQYRGQQGTGATTTAPAGPARPPLTMVRPNTYSAPRQTAVQVNTLSQDLDRAHLGPYSEHPDSADLLEELDSDNYYGPVDYMVNAVNTNHFQQFRSDYYVSDPASQSEFCNHCGQLSLQYSNGTYHRRCAAGRFKNSCSHHYRITSATPPPGQTNSQWFLASLIRLESEDVENIIRDSSKRGYFSKFAEGTEREAEIAALRTDLLGFRENYYNSRNTSHRT